MTTIQFLRGTLLGLVQRGEFVLMATRRCHRKTPTAGTCPTKLNAQFAYRRQFLKNVTEAGS